MANNVAKVLDAIEANLKLQQEKLKLLRNNSESIEYFEANGDVGAWRPFTDEVACQSKDWSIDELRVDLWYLVKTDTGIRLLNKNEYETYMGDTKILYQGSYKACKDFIKV